MSEAHHNQITSLEWQDASPVKKVEITNNAAYLHSNENETDLTALHKTFTNHGLKTAPSTRGGKAVLKLSGFENQESLVNFLEENKAVSGTFKATTQTIIKKESATDWLKSASLRASGIFYELGNALYMIEGVLRKDWAGVGVGAAFGVGDSALVIWGKSNEEKAMNSLVGKIRQQMESQGIKIPEGAAINVDTLAKPSGFLESVNNFMHENVNMIKTLAEVAGGAFMIFSGKKTNNPLKSAAGGTVLLGFLAAQLIQEKKIDPEKFENANLLEKAWMGLESNPLILGGASGLANNALNIVGYRKQYKEMLTKPPGEQEHHYRVGMGAVASMIAANILYAGSKKSHGHDNGDNPLFSDMYAMSAEILAHQPPELREAAIDKTAESMGERVQIKEDKWEAKERLIQEIDRFMHNPWFEKGSQQLAHSAGMAL